MFVLEKYCQRSSLRVNVGKTKVMKHRNGGRLARADQLFFNNTEIEFKDSFEYLGIVLSTKLTGSKHLEHLKKKPMLPLALYNPKSNSEKFVLSPRLDSMRASYFHLLLMLSMFSAMCYHRRKETNTLPKWLGFISRNGSE